MRAEPGNEFAESSSSEVAEIPSFQSGFSEVPEAFGGSTLVASRGRRRCALIDREFLSLPHCGGMTVDGL